MNDRNDKFNQEQLVSQSAQRLSQYTAGDGSSICINCFALQLSSPSRIRPIHLHLFPDTSGDVLPHTSQVSSALKLRIFQLHPPKGQNGSVLSADGEILRATSALHIPCFTAVISSHFFRHLPLLNRLINYDDNIRKRNKSCVGFSCVRPQDRKDRTNTNTLGEQCRNDALWRGNWAGSQKTLIINTSRAPKCHKSFRRSTH